MTNNCQVCWHVQNAFVLDFFSCTSSISNMSNWCLISARMSLLGGFVLLLQTPDFFFTILVYSDFSLFFLVAATSQIPLFKTLLASHIVAEDIPSILFIFEMVPDILSCSQLDKGQV